MSRSVLYIAATVAILSSPPAALATDLFVSPNGRGDQCSKSAPCALLPEAQRAVRRAAAGQSEDIQVNLLDGTYAITAPLALVETETVSDSGQNGHKIVWQAAPNARPVLSGGVQVKGWKIYDKAKNVWRADAPAALNARQLYVNNRRASRTRSIDMMAGNKVTETSFQLTDPATKQPYDISKFRNLTDVEVLRQWEWQSSRCNVLSATATDIFVNPICAYNSREIDLGLFVENAFELLEKPGQFYLDRSGAVSGAPGLYYIPRPEEKLSSATTVLGATEQLLTLTGTRDRPIHDVTIRGLTFTHGTWLLDRSLAAKVGGYSSIQAGVHLLSKADFRQIDAVKTAAELTHPPSVVGGFYDSANLGWDDYVPGVVTANYARHVQFLDNTFSHIGATALALVRGIQDSSITGNEFFDISGSAIQLGGVEAEDRHPCGDVPSCDNGRVTQNNVISNNRVSDVSAEFYDTAAIFIGYTRNSLVSHNELHDLPYTGISMGWGWGLFEPGNLFGYKNPTIAANNRVVNNSIERFMLIQRDGGGIYTLSSQPGSVIANNFIKDGPHHYAGLYSDEGSAGFTVENNVTANVKNFLLLNCSGKHGTSSNNTYRNNYSDDGEMKLNCRRGKNSVETPALFDSKADEKNWPGEVKAIQDQAGLEPDYKKRTQGKITAVEFGKVK